MDERLGLKNYKNIRCSCETIDEFSQMHQNSFLIALQLKIPVKNHIISKNLNTYLGCCLFPHPEILQNLESWRIFWNFQGKETDRQLPISETTYLSTPQVPFFHLFLLKIRCVAFNHWSHKNFSQSVHIQSRWQFWSTTASIEYW